MYPTKKTAKETIRERMDAETHREECEGLEFTGTVKMFFIEGISNLPGGRSSLTIYVNAAWCEGLVDLIAKQVADNPDSLDLGFELI